MDLVGFVRSAGEVVEQWVQTQTTPCHLGGQRHWFTCPPVQ